jgi:hypothetical protein
MVLLLMEVERGRFGRYYCDPLRGVFDRVVYYTCAVRMSPEQNASRVDGTAILSFPTKHQQLVDSNDYWLTILGFGTNGQSSGSFYRGISFRVFKIGEEGSICRISSLW